MAREGFEELHSLHDRDSGLQAFLAIHDTSAGPAFGGIRRWSYPAEHRALLDCMRLARAMTTKCVLAGLPAGGAKVVVLDSGDLDPEQAYRALGRAVERLGGRYYTGPDVGTGFAELQWLSEETRFATDPGPDGPGELTECTAAGVFAGIAAGLRQLDGEEDWKARRIVVQGLGAVGAELTRRLLEVGASVAGCDLIPERATAVTEELGIELLESGTETAEPCDVFSPNGLGGVVHDLSIQRLEARIIAGGANNVLARAVHGDLLHERGVLYVPDSAINSGALIRGCLFHLEGERVPVAEVERRVGESASWLLELAAEREEPPERVSRTEVTRALEARRTGHESGPGGVLSPAGAGHAPQGAAEADSGVAPSPPDSVPHPSDPATVAAEASDLGLDS